VLASPTNKGEYYLTDAFHYMIDKGAKIQVTYVEGWYDAGKIETMLETDEAMLTKGRARKPSGSADWTIVDPVYIEEEVTLTGSTVGPNVSIGKGSVIENSTVSNSIVGTRATIRRSEISNSLVGDEVVLEGVSGEVTVGDHSEVRVRQGG
jgi:glucose-1-phosphate thymidylyltransferase